jgi:hypothetical protein
MIRISNQPVCGERQVASRKMKPATDTLKTAVFRLWSQERQTINLEGRCGAYSFSGIQWRSIQTNGPTAQ